ncbi:cell division protein FtsL [Sporosarcina gallistercoris]|uniref:Cell division protein FtsL n=1 Tax=Sporosarcina gallistercoris TaxID=2762245 RepID=A0ABR8PGE9_9BACL|nr:cell division protein FtsL [Sporosarcina gallistercoris]MBD7907218.1 cell division protein FtsL [Sporosarcina gallistercoris]
MALEQRKIQPNYIPEQETQANPASIPAPKTRKIFSPGEKFLAVVFVAAVVMFSTMVLHTQAQINDTNKEMHVLSNKIEETSKQNIELSNQVSEKSTYERIWEKAKELGLNLNESNVKVVPGR